MTLKVEARMRIKYAVKHSCGPTTSCFMPLEGGALAAAAVEIGQGCGLVLVHGCMGWKHDLQTLGLPASLPWPKEQQKCKRDSL